MDQSTSQVPDHVPAELIWDHDFAEYLHELDDPYMAAARLYDGPGVIWATNAAFGKPAWILTQHDLIREAYGDYVNFSNGRNSLTATVLDSKWLFLPLEIDPPEHRLYRHLLNPFFTPSAINKMALDVHKLCDSLIDKFIDNDRCEFVGEFGSILPNAMVISLLGMPLDMLPQFHQWEKTAICGATVEERIAANHAIFGYLVNLVAEQHQNPTTEFMKGVLSARVKDRSLNDPEILGICLLMYIAGLDTVSSALGWIMRYLAQDSVLQARLRNNPQDIPAAVNEFMRAFGVSSPGRTIPRDFTFHGVQMRQGDAVILPTFLAGRDPRAYTNPNVIDIDRKPSHVTFGNGPHLCLGIHLAIREARVMIESFLSRMSNIHIPAGEPFEYHTTGTLGVDRMTLAFEPVR